METITVTTRSSEELIDITGEVQAAVTRANIGAGICLVYTPHTTAAITINENADPDVRADILRGLASLELERVAFRHAEGNSPAHVKSSLIGCSEMVIVAKGKLQLGTWQGVYFCEFDGPRTRRVLVSIIPG